jgi:hypothetical protein
MTTTAKELEALDWGYQERKEQIRNDPTLSFEKKERQIKKLGDEHHRKRKELEESLWATLRSPIIFSPRRCSERGRRKRPS